ncbi:MAG TPA: hypothetical protein VEV43_05780 [Actinomycetota bacterium]|nr:hypothetical protein [Actinomycetota bacterium]
MKVLATAAVAGLLTMVATGSAGANPNPNAGVQPAPLSGEGEGLKLIKNIPTASGTDMEFATIKGREYGFVAARTTANSPNGGLYVIDVTKPEKAKVAGYLPCNMTQMDIQLSHDKKTVIMAADGAGGPDSCLMVGQLGFMTVDISNPKKPKAIGSAINPRGSHNTTAHPTKPYVYNSDSDLENPRGEIQIWSIKNPAKPELVNTVTSVGLSPHDISFNKKGTQAVTAGIESVELFDTTDPENPTLQSVFQCPGCSITHDAKFTPDDAGLVIGDEGGGGGTYPCPGGALYFYELQQGIVPVLTGVYEPNEVVLAQEGQTNVGPCTSHVFDFDQDGSHLAISWYTAGTRYLDITNPVGPTFGAQGTGVIEAGWFIPDGGNSWSSKIHKGPYIYSNDIARGFDIYKIVGK